MSLSTSSSNNWRSFMLTFTTTAICIITLIYLFILLVDPFDNIPISAKFNRVQVRGPFRFFKPSVARRPIYDSTIIGTSTVILIHPKRLSDKLDASFSNLAIPAASPFEQLRLLRLFADNHSKIKNILVGIDHVWCKTEKSDKFIGAYIGRPPLDKLYDNNQWNNWPKFSSTTLKYTRRQLEALLDEKQDPAGHDGFFDFTKSFPPYNLQHAQSKLYKNVNPVPKPGKINIPGISQEELNQWLFPDLSMLQKSLSLLPKESNKIVVFVPLHWYRLSMDYSKFNECKKRVKYWEKEIENLYIIDFMYYSDITLADNNYWDPVHFVENVAKKIEGAVAEIVKSGQPDFNYYKQL